MILELAGLPGSGKFTIGRVLAEAMSARLVDNHTIANPAFVSTAFGSPEFYEMVRAVRALVFKQLEQLPITTDIILTTAPSRSPARWRELQDASRRLADTRQTPLLGVHLRCSADELARRMRMTERSLLRKITDPDILNDGFDRPVVLDHCDRTLEIDVTALSPAQAAKGITDWIAASR